MDERLTDVILKIRQLVVAEVAYGGGVGGDEFSEKLAGILETLSAQDGGWRNIDSAPKDGTPVMLSKVGCRYPYLGWWKDGGWRNNHYGDREAYWSFTDMTHWMPLPSPPTITPESKDQ